MIARESERSDKPGNSYATFTLPESAIRDEQLETLAVEEIYELLLKQGLKNGWVLEVPDLLEGNGKGKGDQPGDPAKKRAVLAAHWRAAQAERRRSLAWDRARFLLVWSVNCPPLIRAVDRRSRLWRYMVKTPTDYSGFDRRFVGRGLYLEQLDGETVQVWVGIDTSGSIGQEEMGAFLGEVKGILQAYPHIRCSLFYCDAQSYGPYEMVGDTDASDFPKLVGGGGTSFVPFFEAVETARQIRSRRRYRKHHSACLTDG